MSELSRQLKRYQGAEGDLSCRIAHVETQTAHNNSTYNRMTCASRWRHLSRLFTQTANISEDKVFL